MARRGRREEGARGEGGEAENEGWQGEEEMRKRKAKGIRGKRIGVGRKVLMIRCPLLASGTDEILLALFMIPRELPIHEEKLNLLAV